MIVLGINGGVRMGYQDTSAAVVVDGKIVAAVEEERLNRIKFAPGQLPELAISAALKKARVGIRDVDCVASHGSTWGDQYPELLRDYLRFRFGHAPRVERVHHHTAHAASAFFASGFDEAMILTIDASGDSVSTQFCLGAERSIKVLEQIHRPNSLGLYYSMFTQYCGFVRDSDEYKLMGLASYGTPTIDLGDVLSCGQGAYRLNEAYLRKLEPGAPQPTRQQCMYSAWLEEKLGAGRNHEDEINDHYRNVAASAQRRLEEVLVDVVHHFHQRTRLRKLCLAGGVALNCVANQKLMNLECLDEIYIQPAAADSGVALGAALYVANELGDRIEPMPHVYLGPAFTQEQIHAFLTNAGCRFRSVDDPAALAAERVAAGAIVGWFQGASEFGPRALGNRSVLASALRAEMKDIVNEKVKFRESFRPFCPSVLEEDAPLYFEGKAKSAPYMIITYDVKEPARSVIPAVTHIDNTARIQTVTRAQNSLFYDCLTELKRLTGHGVVLNTSFNIKGEPMVNSPREALATFSSSGMDTLVMGNFVVEKK